MVSVTWSSLESEAILSFANSWAEVSLYYMLSKRASVTQRMQRNLFESVTKDAIIPAIYAH